MIKLMDETWTDENRNNDAGYALTRDLFDSCENNRMPTVINQMAVLRLQTFERES